MLNEPTLIFLATLVASGFLVLGVLELLWPTKPRRRRLVGASTTDLPFDDPVRTAVDAPVAIDASEDAPEPLTLVATDRFTVRGSSRSGRITRGKAATSTASAGLDAFRTGDLFAIETSAAHEAASSPAQPLQYADVLDQRTELDTTLERCRRMIDDGCLDEAVATAMAVLEQPGAASPAIASALWQAVARAYDGMGDRDRALVAYRNAIEAAPADDRENVRRELAAGAVRTAVDLVRAAEDTERYAALLLARDFLAAAHETVGASSALEAARADLVVELWSAYEAQVHELVGNRAYTEAYRLSTEALADASLPEAHRPTFEALRTETLAGLIDALVSHSLRAVDEGYEWEAVGDLEQAEALLNEAPRLSAARRDEAKAKVAAAYGQLGRRRVDAGDFEEAVDPLLRALRLDDTDEERQEGARWAMVHALEAVVDARAAAIRDLAERGNRESALRQAGQLWALLRTAMAAGVPQASMPEAIAMTRQLREDLGRDTARAGDAGAPES